MIKQRVSNIGILAQTAFTPRTTPLRNYAGAHTRGRVPIPQASHLFPDCTHSEKMTAALLHGAWAFVFNITSTLPDMKEANGTGKPFPV